MTIEELCELLRSEFPKLFWQIDNTKYVVAYYRNVRFQAYIGMFADHVHDGREYIGISGDAHSQGGSRPCIGVEEAMNEMRKFIERFAPKLLEDEQLTLF